MFLEQLKENLLSGSDKKALMYSDGTSYTYAELDRISGKISAWLKSQGIGKEDTVLITMPRGIEIIAAMVGVIRAGACFVVCESSMAAERIRFIAENSHSKKGIVRRNWEEILASDYDPEFAVPDAHDSAYIVYTSGTTGNPKGVIHEYGNYDQSLMAKRLNGEFICRTEDVLGLNAPLNFVAAVDYIINALFRKATLFLIETNIVKNVNKLMELYKKEHVTYTFMTPSLYKSIPELSPTLERIMIGGEPCVGLYNEDIQLINGYNMSEAGRDMLLFPIMQPHSTTPVGHNRGEEEILLLDEDGVPVPDGEIGEICFANEYVRGYLGLPEKTQEAWKNGIYHTSDLGRRENDEIVLLGRNDDMIKINGNRIEPTEIEVVAKKVLKLTQVIVKGFISPERNFIVLYYTGDKILDPQSSRSALAGKLTSYMLPSYFVHLDEIPMLPNGKVNKKVLEAPSLDSYRQEYEAPSTETEKELAALFEKILGIEKIGVNDDFYELGGDSLKSIQLIMEYDRDTLDAQTVFKCRTVRNIAAEIERNIEELQTNGLPQFDTPEEKEAYARAQTYPLTAFQTNMVDYQLFEPWSTMWNLKNVFRFDLNTTDPDRLYEAVQTVAENTPIFRTYIRFNETCELEQYIDPDAVPAVSRVRMTEEEFKDAVKTVNHPFSMTGRPFIEAKVFQTESSIYLYILAHHLIIDGKGFEALQDNIAEVYRGHDMRPDTYYSYLLDAEASRNSRKYSDARQYFEKTYENRAWCNCPEPDSEIRDHRASVLPVRVPVTSDKLAAIEGSTGLSRNGLAAAVILLAMAADTEKDNVMMSWVYHQRTDQQKKNAAGLLINQLPIGVTMSTSTTLADLYADIREKVNAGMANTIYEWVLNHTVSFEEDALMMIYEGDLLQWGQIADIGAEPVDLTTDEDIFSIRKMCNMILEDPEGLTMILYYLKNAYTPEHMEKLQKLHELFAGTVFSDVDPQTVKISDLLAEGKTL